MKVIKIRIEMMSYRIVVGLKFNDGGLVRHKKGHTKTQKESDLKTETRIRVMMPQAVNVRSHQKLEMTKRILP